MEGDISDYRISIDMAKKTRQLPEYTRNKGFDKAKIQQMIIQYLQNAGTLGAKRDAIFEYLKEVLPQNKTHEQQERLIGNILSEMKEIGLIHPESAGQGLNLQEGGCTIVWFGLTWSLELYQQMNARLWRQGQKHTVVIHHLITKGTHDEDVMKALEKKETGQSALIHAVRARIGGM